MIPDKKHNKTALCQTPFAAWNVNRDAIADGPIGTSLHEPKKIYTKHPKNEPYNPNYKIKFKKMLNVELLIFEYMKLTAGGSPAMPE